MTLELVSPSDLGVAKREAGGDNEVPRTANGRPLILNSCYKCEGSGRLPSAKKPPPATVQCDRCKGTTEKLEAYTRTTTFIDVLDDKSNLMSWEGRMVLLGVATDPTLTDGVLDYDRDSREGKDALDRRAKAAKQLAGSEDKADKGTFLHGLSERIDQGQNLPDTASINDIIDTHAYAEGTVSHLKIRHIEQLVVSDHYKVAGTPDRVSEAREPGNPLLVAPDGYQFEPGELLITDLKTGRVDYGALKMAMQLSMYANSKGYDKDTGKRFEMENLNREWGLIMHVAAGSGVCDVYWADLVLGWRAVELAWQVREIRKEGKRDALTVAWTTQPRLDFQ